MALNIIHQTKAEFASRFWARLKDAYDKNDKLTVHRLSYWVYLRIQDGDFTSNDLRLTFNAYFGKDLNPSQWTTLVQTRFVPIKDRYEALLAEAEIWQ